MIPKMLQRLITFLTLILFTLPGIAAPPPLLPLNLKPGDTVALVSSSFRVDNNTAYRNAQERLQSLGLKVITGKAVLGKNAYFAGSAEARAADLNEAFANPNVKAIIEIRGGFGSTQLLSKLDYKLIGENPKILIGFSDITALLIAIQEKTGLVTFHGPMPGVFTWTKLTTQSLRKTLFETGPQTLANPPSNPIQVIHGGQASGILIGGNLAVLASLIGTPYAPTRWDDKILFVEDTHEDVYQIDRLLTQLELAGILPKIKGFIFGSCVDCKRQIKNSPTLQAVLDAHIKPLGIPAWSGAMIGHQDSMWTLPEGAPASINADKGTISFDHYLQ